MGPTLVCTWKLLFYIPFLKLATGMENKYMGIGNCIHVQVNSGYP